MYYVYILKSLISNHYYTGYSDNLSLRLQEHNSGKSKWTNRYKPWKIIYSENFEKKSDALSRERYFKSHSGRDWIKRNITTNF